MEKRGILFHIEKAAESSDGDLTCHMLSLANAPAHFATSKFKRILIIKK